MRTRRVTLSPRRRPPRRARRTHEGTFRKLTRTVDGQVRIIGDPPVIVPVDELVTDPSQVGRFKEIMDEFTVDYAATLPPDRRHLFNQYRFVDFARKFVGVGSVGTRAWIHADGRHQPIAAPGRDDPSCRAGPIARAICDCGALLLHGGACSPRAWPSR